jgi:hypothetical protein
MCLLEFIYFFGFLQIIKLSLEIIWRRELNDKICLFCTEVETISNLFYECCVAKRIWEVMAEITDVPLITDFESMAKWWIRGKKCNPDNVIYAVVLSSLWKLKISLCFQGDGVRRL